MEADAEIVKAIMEGSIKVKTFDFDGQKYTRENIYDINDQLTAEIMAAKRQLTLHDQQIFGFFYNQAEASGQESELIREYENHFTAAHTVEKDVAIYNSLMEELQVVFQKEMSFKAAEGIVDQILIYEKPLKERLKFILGADDFQACITSDRRQQLEAYLANQNPYFTLPDFNHEPLALLTEALQTYIQVVLDWNFKQKKAFLEKQLQWKKDTETTIESTHEISGKTVGFEAPKVNKNEPAMAEEN